jgi:hypothetical protein
MSEYGLFFAIRLELAAQFYDALGDFVFSGISLSFPVSLLGFQKPTFEDSSRDPWWQTELYLTITKLEYMSSTMQSDNNTCSGINMITIIVSNDNRT